MLISFQVLSSPAPFPHPSKLNLYEKRILQSLRLDNSTCYISLDLQERFYLRCLVLAFTLQTARKLSLKALGLEFNKTILLLSIPHPSPGSRPLHSAPPFPWTLSHRHGRIRPASSSAPPRSAVYKEERIKRSLLPPSLLDPKCH